MTPIPCTRNYGEIVCWHCKAKVQAKSFTQKNTCGKPTCRREWDNHQAREKAKKKREKIARGSKETS